MFSRLTWKEIFAILINLLMNKWVSEQLPVYSNLFLINKKSKCWKKLLEIPDHLDKQFARDHSCSQAFKVRSVHLAVYQLHSLILQFLDVPDKNVLAGIAYFAKHALTKKNLSEPDAIQPTHKFAVLPGL